METIEVKVLYMLHRKAILNLDEVFNLKFYFIFQENESRMVIRIDVAPYSQ